MTHPLTIDQLEKEIALLCLEHPDLYDDETLRADVIEGETDAFSVLSRLTDKIQEDEALEAALAERITRMKERKERLTQRSDGYRALALRIMHAANLRKVTLPEATLSIRPVAPKVEFDDPEDFLRRYPKYHRVKTEIDRTKVKADLAAGIVCEGAHLTNGTECLALKTN